MKKVIISGGGTGGHIFPALSIANALKRLDKDIEILFVGAEGKMEMEKVPEAGYKIVGLPVRGLQRKLTLSNLKVLWNLWRSLKKAKRVVQEFKPDVVVGVGGYASGPIGKVAANAGIPLVLQEQNSYAGVTNKLLAKKAAKICVAYEGMERFFPKEKIIFTGNPVRKDLLNAANERAEGIAFYGLDANKKTVLITGGSLGAGSINKAMVRWLEKIAGWKNVQVIWQCGSYYHKELEEQLKGRMPENVKFMPFLKRMDLAYACADLVVARAGAGTISELCLLGKAAVLVPSPNVAEDHQTKNAMALVNKQAAVMVKDAEVVERLGEVMERLLQDDGERKSLSDHILTLAMKNSDEVIAREILKIM
ncbi:undecaprenyldiphospho-muramoylpentapeptide beta-N-acetylglucosaminyltransferase [Butyricimonas faecalis]|uniref:UDP-N-acetylglucosamine--N-acetylmuramyl-(pentapeptide) pyrophosphoryl-undecaprenol N-acetylglucosamine transferase n=1 Tax=Butyricimonas faecalis TaxID=2093856 RepID=A0A3S9VR90_9BACT|nr:undecaprenyldiphospho-muramoylpentapeptide beta-N-acetylglucosaminyltransferase [Butyricimonas faecalis]AZS29019.1 undecaprenyldiphospho-muramoylpentapeptide beta-N-acetylglucosaminyltransferase [Butyricimonas faecalis]